MIWKVHEKEKYTNLLLVACWSTSNLAIGKKFTEEERILQRAPYVKTSCSRARLHLRTVVWYLHTCTVGSSGTKKNRLAAVPMFPCGERGTGRLVYVAALPVATVRTVILLLSYWGLRIRGFDNAHKSGTVHRESMIQFYIVLLLLLLLLLGA